MASEKSSRAISSRAPARLWLCEPGSRHRDRDHSRASEINGRAAQADDAACSNEAKKARYTQRPQRRSMAQYSGPRTRRVAEDYLARPSLGDRLRIDDFDPTGLAVFSRQIR